MSINWKVTSCNFTSWESGILRFYRSWSETSDIYGSVRQRKTQLKHFFPVFIKYEQLKPQITKVKLGQMDEKTLCCTTLQCNVWKHLWALVCVSAFHSHLCTGPLQHCVVAESPHGSDYPEQRVKLQRTYRTGALQQPLIHIFTSSEAHVRHTYSERINFICEACFVF